MPKNSKAFKLIVNQGVLIASTYSFKRIAIQILAFQGVSTEGMIEKLRMSGTKNPRASNAKIGPHVYTYIHKSFSLSSALNNMIK